MNVELGRRIERVFYFGAFLIILCFAQVYLVTTVDYVKSQNPAGLAELAAKLGSNVERLQDLFNAPPPTTATTVHPDLREAAVKQVRIRLGLPPEIKEVPEPVETYSGLLAKIVAEASVETGMEPEVLGKSVDATKAPQVNIEKVLADQKVLASKPVLIWGIETPIVLPLQYGKAEYEIPTPVLANCLLVALAPLLLVWFGSLYITRQRELLFIRSLDDCRHAFPHILNIFPVNYLSFPWIWENRMIKRKQKRQQEVTAWVVCSLLRTTIILMFAIPIFGAFVYSEMVLLSLKESPSFVEIAFFLVTSIWLFIQIIMLNAQEWILLWGKTFVV